MLYAGNIYQKRKGAITDLILITGKLIYLCNLPKGYSEEEQTT
jgi:hypothetical protein